MVEYASSVLSFVIIIKHRFSSYFYGTLSKTRDLPMDHLGFVYSPNIIINGTLFTLKYVPVGVLSCVLVLVKGDLPESIEVA